MPLLNLLMEFTKIFKESRRDFYTTPVLASLATNLIRGTNRAPTNPGNNVFRQNRRKLAATDTSGGTPNFDSVIKATLSRIPIPINVTGIKFTMMMTG